MKRTPRLRPEPGWLRRAVRMAIAGLSCLVPLHACADLPSDLPDTVTRDSSGVRIVESRRPTGLADAWIVSPEPSVVIGTLEAAPEYLLDRVRGAIRLSNGAILIADGGTRELRIYDGAGNFLVRIGRPGEGPGEFEELSRIFRYSGDTIAVVDARRLQLFTPSGGYLEALPIERAGVSDVLGSLEDGSIVLARQTTRISDRVTTRTVWRLAYDRVSRSGEPISRLAELPEMTVVPTTSARREPVPIVFGPRLGAAVGANKLFVGLPNDFIIDVYEADTGLALSLRKPWTPIPVEQSAVDAYLESFYRLGASERTPLAPEIRELREEIARDFVYSDYLPAFADLVVDDLGYLWVSDYDVEHALVAPRIRTISWPTRWSVFDPVGVWRTRVEMPGRFTPLQIGSDFVLGLNRDDLGVERLALLPLRRGPP